MIGQLLTKKSAREPTPTTTLILTPTLTLTLTPPERYRCAPSRGGQCARHLRRGGAGRAPAFASDGTASSTAIHGVQYRPRNSSAGVGGEWAWSAGGGKDGGGERGGALRKRRKGEIISMATNKACLIVSSSVPSRSSASQKYCLIGQNLVTYTPIV